MRRFTYTAFSFKESELEKQIEEYAKSKGFALDCISCGGAKAFRLTKEKMIIETVFRIREKTVYIDVQSDIDIDKSLELVIFLTKRGFLVNRDMEYKGDPIECTGEKLTEYFADVIARKRKPELAIVYLSRMGNGHGYGCEINEYALAKRLHGIAHVLVETDDTQRVMKKLLKERKTDKWLPYTGRVGIYYPNGEYNILCDQDTSSERFDAARFIVLNITEAATQAAEPGRLTFDKLLIEQLRKRPAEVKSVVVDDQLRARIEQLENEKKALEEELDERLKDIEKLRRESIRLDGINVSRTEEGREGELRDLIITALDAYVKNLPDDYRRAKSLLKDLLLLNRASDYEKNLVDKLDKCFKSGEIDPSFLTDFGFEKKREKTHTVYEYQGITDIFSCTPSDCRSRDNEISNFKKSFFVCR